MDRRISNPLDIAAGEFGRQGSGGISLNRIVALSGVSKTTILRRFGTKAGLFHTLIDRTIAEIHDGLARVRLGPDDPEGMIGRFVQTYALAAAIQPALIHLSRHLIGRQKSCASCPKADVPLSTMNARLPSTEYI